jgi:hypothetical protein
MFFHKNKSRENVGTCMLRMVRVVVWCSRSQLSEIMSTFKLLVVMVWHVDKSESGIVWARGIVVCNLD